MSFDIEKILDLGLNKGASDIHLSPGKPVYFRVNGYIYGYGEPVGSQDIENLVAQILTGSQQAKLQEFRDIDFIYGGIRKGKRFRGNIYHTRDGMAVALRAIPEQVPEFQTLGVPNFVLEFIMGLKKGLVLVTGPTGHGKSTTLASLIKNRADRTKEHLILLEDPIEFLINSESSIVHQRAFERDVMSFERGIRAALREDPDVLMVGEMRDTKTVASVLTAAETGHVVFSTLHTNSAAETISRVIDVFPANQQQQIKSQVASTLSMVISQRLIEDTSGGRVLVCEVMVNNYAIKNHIRHDSIFQIPNAMQMDDSGMMVLLEESLAQLIINGKITYNTALAVTSNIEQLDYILENAGYKGAK